MNGDRRSRGARRRAYTLTEILVTITVIAIMAGLTAAFLPKFSEQQRAARGAEQLQGWLLLAKQWAIRDQSPRGLRITADVEGLARELIYMEQPDDFVPKVGQTVLPLSTMTNPGPPPFTVVNIPGLGLNPAAGDERIKAGDYLKFGDNHVRRIAAAPPPGVDTFALVQPAEPSTVTGDTMYRIIRQPRRMTEQSVLAFRDTGVAIDLNAGFSQPSLMPGQTLDIMFQPNGTALVSINGSTSIVLPKVILWVRDTNADPRPQGNPTLITIYCRTGFITAHPIDPSGAGAGGDWYSFTRDGRSSGM